MSKEKKEEKKEEKKSPELVAAEEKVELDKKMAEEVARVLKDHNCTVDGQVEMHDGKMSTHVVYVPNLVTGEEKADRKKRAEDAMVELDKSLKDLGHEFTASAVLRSGGAQFHFGFKKLEE